MIFMTLKIWKKIFIIAKIEKKILITIDDAFSSFYENAWPYLKEKKFHLFFLFQLKLLGKMDI